MIENKYQEKVKFLYIIVCVLLVLMIGMFIYFQSKIKEHDNNFNASGNMTMALFKRINSVIELNNLDSDLYKYIINPSDWKEILKKECALTLDDLDDYTIEKILLKQKNEMTGDDLSEWTITFNISDDGSFDYFTKLIYQKISDILVMTHNDTSKVESFKEGRGYYDINSFSEATYNNMYYDYIKTMSDGSTGGPKIKIKLLYLEDTNQIKMEINKF